MQDFERFTGINLGGQREYEFAPMDEIATLPYVANGSCTSEVEFKPGKRWLKAYSTPETINVKEDPKQKPAGTLYQLKVDSFYPKQSPEAIANLLAMNGRRFAVLITDNNGLKKLFLNMRFSFTPVSQKSPNKRPGYSLNFFLDSTKPAYFYPY